MIIGQSARYIRQQNTLVKWCAAVLCFLEEAGLVSRLRNRRGGEVPGKNHT